MTDRDAKVQPNKEGGFAPNYTPFAHIKAAMGFRRFLLRTNIHCPNTQSPTDLTDRPPPPGPLLADPC